MKRFIAIFCIILPSSLSRLLYRLCGYHIGKNVKLPFLSYIYANEIEIGNDVDIRTFVFINVDKLTIGSNTIISVGTQIIGDKKIYN